MCRQKKPRLERKAEKNENFKMIINDQDFWIIVFITIILIILIIMALHESVSYFVYNNGLPNL